MEIIFATQNAHKVQEVVDILKDDSISIKSLKDLACDVDIVEDGLSFEENALLKAKGIFEIYKIPVFSEDSGLVVDALGGAPGIHSARYAGEDRDHDKNITKLLEALGDNQDRTARFVSNICYYDGETTKHFYGAVEGRIGFERSGNGGFGYDPVFIPNGYQDSFAVLSDNIKNKISHRKNSLEAFCAWLGTGDI